MTAVQTEVEALNAATKEERLQALRALMEKVKSGAVQLPARGIDVNNHIHTTYSFSPYSPTKAVWMCLNAGLSSGGIMDHDSVAGAEEFVAAGEIAGLPTTIGVECRADCSATRLSGRRINNPDQNSVAYMALHGIPHQKIGAVRAFFAPSIAARERRNIGMVERLNGLFENKSLHLQYERDVRPLSQAEDGGTVTERHLLYALSLRLLEVFPKADALVGFLEKSLGLPVSAKVREMLEDEKNPFRAYDLLGLLKGELVAKFYIDGTDECEPIRKVVAFAREIGAIPAYAYLGDVGDSVTGDKKTQSFEDSYLDLLFEELSEIGFQAVTYMPSRNTMPQLERVRGLCDKYGMFQISGEDINSPRQKFICEALRNPAFHNLIDATWALIGHERAASKNLADSFFGKETVKAYPALTDRIAAYKKLGLA